MDSSLKISLKNKQKELGLNENLEIKSYVYPEPSMFDSKINIVVKNLPSNVKFTLHSMVKSGENIFECLAVYCSNSSGQINLNEHSCLEGYYTGVEPMGLLWAMKSRSGIAKRLMKRDVTTPLVVEVNIYKGAITTMENFETYPQKHVLAHFCITRLFMAPGVTRLEIEEGGLLGTLFFPPGKGPFPGVISLFGAMPCTLEYRSALLASHGYASLALSYVGLKGLPQSVLNLHMDYFEKAVNFLCNHTCVCGNQGIGVIGTCKGGQIALAMADCLQGIKCVVAINCTLFSYYGNFYYKGKLWKPCSTDENTLRNNSTLSKDQRSVVLRNTYKLFSMSDPEFTSYIFNFHKRPNISYMYIAGLEDENVPSEYFCNLAEKLLKSVDHPNYTTLSRHWSCTRFPILSF